MLPVTDVPAIGAGTVPPAHPAAWVPRDFNLDGGLRGVKRIPKLERLRLRGPNRARDEFHLAATAQNLRKLAKLIPMQEPSPA